MEKQSLPPLPPILVELSTEVFAYAEAYALAAVRAERERAAFQPLSETRLHEMWEAHSFAGLSGQTSHRWLEFARAIEAAIRGQS